MSEDLDQVRRLKWRPSRIPPPDALEVFIPDGTQPDAELSELQSRSGQSRSYPMEGGHRVLILYEGGPFNARRFTLAKGGWDHEHCSRCGATIKPMTLCWVTESGPYVLLDDKCYREAVGPDSVA